MHPYFLLLVISLIEWTTPLSMFARGSISLSVRSCANTYISAHINRHDSQCFDVLNLQSRVINVLLYMGY